MEYIIKEKLKNGTVVTHRYKGEKKDLRTWNKQKGKKLWVCKGGKIIEVKVKKQTTIKDPIGHFLGRY